MFTSSRHVTLLASLAALVLALPPATVTAGAAGTNQAEGLHVEAPNSMQPSANHVVTTGGLYEVHILLTADINDRCVFVKPWSYRRITELEAEVRALRAEVEELKRGKSPWTDGYLIITNAPCVFTLPVYEWFTQNTKGTP